MLLATAVLSAQGLGGGAAPTAPVPFDVSGLVRLEMAGNPLDAYPHFEFVRAFFEGAPISVAIDPTRHPAIAGASGDLYLIARRPLESWSEGAGLVDVRGAPQPVSFGGADVRGNTVVLAGADALSGDAGTGLGVPYDVVFDANSSGALDLGDWVDGIGAEPGLFVVRPTHEAGPLAVTELIYSGGTFLGQDLYYPTEIATLGELPLVVVSHGNGHSYVWYDHVGFHLASYGCVVMSHQNETQPGIETASTTTLRNTDYLLGNLATIAGGALLGHVDPHRIVWIGHSRGGEGVVRAYDRIVDGTYVPSHFTAADIRLVSSIAPTDFLGPVSTDPHGVNYHLWVGGADADVTGCADCSICQSFHLLDRATGTRQSTSYHGVGHGAFHNGGGSNVATGPCLVSRADTHVLMKSYLLPLVKRYVEGNLPAEDFLWRQWERFRPPGAPETSCIVVDLQYARGPSPDRFVVDDFQSEPATTVSSSGGPVQTTFTDFTEGRLDDPDLTFTTGVGAMNGMTLGGASDTTAGIAFAWAGEDLAVRWGLPGGSFDVTAYDHLSFRACQVTRDLATEPMLGDLQLEVALVDSQGGSSAVGIGAYGGGLEIPYLRPGCGVGAGWGNEFETIRIRLEDFARDGAAVDLGDVAWIEVRCGPVHGMKEGRIGFDDLVLTRD